MDHPYGPLSLLPPIVAIALAIVTRRAAVSLMAGLLSGALITTHGDLALALHDLFEVHLWPTFTSPDKLRVFSFTLLMGAMIGIVSRCGGMHGLVALISPWARTRTGGQMAGWVLGLAIFFDDYANTMLLGNTLRPLCDRLRISREKLAYLVDSTAAPVAGLSLLSTWVAVEIEFLKEGLNTLGNPAGLSAFDLFVASIPYRFYVLGALAFVPLIALSGRDFGAMRKAERRTWLQADDVTLDDPATPLDEQDAVRPSHWLNAAIPIAATLGVVLVLLYQSGSGKLPPSADPLVPSPPLREILGAADTSMALQYGALAGLAVAALLSWGQRLLSYGQIVDACGRGAAVVLPAVAILWCASTLSRMTSDRSVDGRISVDAAGQQTFAFQDHRLYTGDYLTRQIVKDQSGERIESAATLHLLPTVVFLLAAVVSFCTGTSFGTMGILVPMVLTLTHALISGNSGHPVEGANPLLLSCIGSVLAGAVFGDHCSPISDTTILSSQSCACDHMAHVMTQMPYALTVAAVAIGLGTLPIGFGVSVWLLIPLQVAALAGIVYVFGRRI